MLRWVGIDRESLNGPGVVRPISRYSQLDLVSLSAKVENK